MKTIAERLKIALDSIEQTAIFANRNASDISLLAVSKTKPVEDIRAAYDVGQRLFGENYVQEGVEKIAELADLTDIEWHYIGPLQSNKTKLVAEHFDWVQTIDREKIAKRLNEQRPAEKGPLNVCIQVNISGEASKSGIEPEAIPELANTISALPNLCLRGLMAIPAPESDPEKQKEVFASLQSLYQDLTNSYPTVDTLSMGMSGDMHQAIDNGSTMVRLGTAIFGARNYS